MRKVVDDTGGITKRDINSRKRICIVGSSKRFFGGLTTHTIFLANALAKHNQVSVILLRNLLPRFLYPGRKHIGQTNPLVDFHPDIDVYDGMDWNSPLSWHGAYRFLKKHCPDTLIIQWWSSSVAHMELFLTIANRLGPKSKVILEMHEVIDPLEESILPIRLYSRLAGKLIKSKVDIFATHSTSAKKQVAEIYKIDEQRIVVIPIGLYENYHLIADDKLSRKGLGIEEEFVILYFGLIRKYKGVPCLVEAFNKLPRDIALNSRLLVVGEDWGDDTLVGEAVNSSPYKRQITYNPQFVADEMISKYFSAADVVVLPYLRTAGSGVANIAMAYGKPVITSDIETMREGRKDYKGASFVAVGDTATIAERLAEIYTQHKSGKVMLCNPPQTTWDEVARQYKNIIEGLGE